MELSLALSLPGGRNASWTPAQLGSALKGEWDAERADLITTVGAAVSSFKDTVAGYDAVQGVGAYRPLYSATSFNGRPGITFDGLDDEMTFAGVGAFPTGATAGEIWALIDQTALPADTSVRVFSSYGGALNTQSRRSARAVVGGVNRARIVTGDGATTFDTTNGLVDFSGRHVVRAIYGATESKINVDGQEDPTPTAAVPATGTTRTRLGANTQNAAAQFYQGVVNYVAITTTLTAEQTESFIQYLKIRGGIA